MSHFSTVRTTLKCPSSLVAGLRDVLSPLSAGNLESFLAEAIQEHDKPVKLETAYSDKGYAEIVVQRGAIGHHTDIGFRLNQETGVYELVSDDYGYDRSTLAGHYPSMQEFQQALQVRHDRHFAVAQLTQQGFYVDSEVIDPTDQSVKLVLVR